MASVKSRELGLDDPYGSFPTWHILWFCNSKQIFTECSCLIVEATLQQKNKWVHYPGDDFSGLQHWINKPTLVSHLIKENIHFWSLYLFLYISLHSRKWSLKNLLNKVLGILGIRILPQAIVSCNLYPVPWLYGWIDLYFLQAWVKERQAQFSYFSLILLFSTNCFPFLKKFYLYLQWHQSAQSDVFGQVVFPVAVA